MDSCFEKWIPFALRDTMYDLADLSMGKEGFSFLLVPDGKHKCKLAGHTVTLTWETVDCFQVTDERYREDCWCSEPAAAWSFFRAEESPWLTAFRKASPLAPAGTIHYRLIGTNQIVDILASQLPKIIIT